MKLLTLILLLGVRGTAIAETAPKKNVPKYNAAAEAVYKGTVLDLRDRDCPVSGGMGAHIILKLDGGTEIEVHLSTTSFTKMVEMNLQKGDQIEVTGWKTEFDGVQTIFAREIKHGNDVFVFRSKDGTPAWMTN
jgi:DNA/RNA endonuclease YhcR with UshA esterase domain